MLVDEKRGRGRPPHEPTDELRAKVKQMAGIGASNVDIARYLRISIDTLSKYYADELERGPLELNLAVGNAAFYQAVGLKITVGDDGKEYLERCEPVPTMTIWWTKTRMGWKELPTEHHLTIDQQTPEQLEAELEALRSRKRIAGGERVVAPGANGKLPGILH
jgi:hypothetical protein